MNQSDNEFGQVSELIETAFDLFDRHTSGTAHAATERAALMIHASQAAATLLAAREQRLANLLAAAYAPENLQVDPVLTRAAYEAAVGMLGLLETDEPPMTAEQFADLFAGKDDPADKDVTE